MLCLVLYWYKLYKEPNQGIEYQIILHTEIQGKDSPEILVPDLPLTGSFYLKKSTALVLPFAILVI